jgi:hypothetical protein
VIDEARMRQKEARNNKMSRTNQILIIAILYSGSFLRIAEKLLKDNIYLRTKTIG